MSLNGDRNLNKPAKKRKYEPSKVREVSWAEVNAETIRDLLVSITASGCAVRFGYSRDRGAFCIGVVGDGEPYTVWAGSTDELDIRMESLLQAFGEPEPK